MAYIGESCALLTAISLVSSFTLYSKLMKTSSPLLLNLWRGLFSVLWNFSTLYFFCDRVFPDESFNNYMLLILSGFMGLSLGDSFQFTALEYIGPRQAILLETLAPTFTGIISYFYFGQTLSFLGWVGMFLTIFGIYIVVYEKDTKSKLQQQQQQQEDLELGIELVDLKCDIQKPINTQSKISLSQKSSKEQMNDSQKRKIIGILCGIAFTICQSIGIILSFEGQKSRNFSPLQGSFLRILAGTVGVSIIFSLKKEEKLQSPCKTKKEHLIFFIATFMGSYIGLWAQQMSITYTRPEISQTIIATTPLFSLVISWYEGEQMKLKYFIGSFVAVLGVCIIVWF